MQRHGFLHGIGLKWACAAVAVAVTLAGCGGADKGDAPPKPGTLTIDAFGEQHAFELTAVSLYHTDVADDEKAEYPDWYVLTGPGVILTGSVPSALSLKEKGPDAVLAGEQLPVAAKMPDYCDFSGSRITIKGVEHTVEEGSVTLDPYRMEMDALYHTPVTGRVVLTLQTGTGPVEVNGTFTGTAHSWF